MQMKDLVDRVSQRTHLDPTMAERAIGSLLSVMEQEGQGNNVNELFARLPGAHELAREYAVNGTLPQHGGLTGVFGSIVASVGGGKIQSLLGALSQLRTIGLNRMQLAGVAQEVFAFAREAAGPEITGVAMASVPGLADMLPNAA
jgi:Protein of unknown function VcgC/VcgE (DUF2780)